MKHPEIVTKKIKPRYLRPIAAAEYLGISRRLLQYRVSDGSLPVIHLSSMCPVYDIKDLDKFAQSRKTRAVKK
jgi:hypothetical protein